MTWFLTLYSRHACRIMCDTRLMLERDVEKAQRDRALMETKYRQTRDELDSLQLKVGSAYLPPRFLIVHSVECNMSLTHSCSATRSLTLSCPECFDAYLSLLNACLHAAHAIKHAASPKFIFLQLHVIQRHACTCQSYTQFVSVLRLTMYMVYGVCIYISWTLHSYRSVIRGSTKTPAATRVISLTPPLLNTGYFISL
jgi:hypothetical protein